MIKRRSDVAVVESDRPASKQNVLLSLSTSTPSSDISLSRSTARRARQLVNSLNTRAPRRPPCDDQLFCQPGPAFKIPVAHITHSQVCRGTRGLRVSRYTYL